MNGINAPKVVECFGSDGHKYRQLAKSGNDDLRQDAVGISFLCFVPHLSICQTVYTFMGMFGMELLWRLVHSCCRMELATNICLQNPGFCALS